VSVARPPSIPWRVRGPILALAAAPRVWAAFADQGLFWPDEFYQSLEQSHRFAFGYGIVPWEFVEGARSWVFPGAIGALWKLLAGAGVTSAATLVVSAKLMMVVMAVLGVEAAMRLAHRMAGLGAAVLAGMFVAMFPALVLFGSKCMTETASAPLVLASALLAWDVPASEPRRRLRLAAAGAIAALAIFFRYQNGVVALGLLAVVASRRRWRDALDYAIGATAVGLAGGMLDWITWGQPFHAFLEDARFHLENRSAPWGSSPPSYYFEFSWRSGGPAMLLALVGFATMPPRLWAHGLLVVAYVAIHSFVPHKEYRYVTPIVPLFLTLSSVGLVASFAPLQRWSERWAAPAASRALRSKRAGPVALAIATALVIAGFTERTIDMTFADLGHGDGLAAGLAFGDDRPWHAAEGINRLLWAAGAAPDLCGVVVKDIPWSSTGGYAYLHRDVPMMFRYTKRNLASANYLIARREFHQPAEYREGPESRGFMLFHRSGACAPPPPEFTRSVPP
jgi:hypothetical protein